MSEMDDFKLLADKVLWRPIETAPKDGTRILCYCERRIRFRIMRWHQPANPDARGFWVSPDGTTPPLCWMPLPDAPYSDGQQARTEEP